MLIVKMMTSTRTPDEQPDSGYTLFASIRTVNVGHRGDGHHFIELTDERFETYSFGLFGTVYVMNEAGKTISTYQPSIEHSINASDADPPFMVPYDLNGCPIGDAPDGFACEHQTDRGRWFVRSGGHWLDTTAGKPCTTDC